MKLHTHLGPFMASAVVVLGIGTIAGAVQGTNSKQRRSTDRPSEFNFAAIRPHDRLDRYLGQNLPPSHWADLHREVADAIGSCMEEQGVANLASNASFRSLPHEELRGTNLASFREQYGYGLTVTLSTDVESSADATESPRATPEQEAIYLKCSEQGTQLIADALPSPDVHRTYRLLLREIGERPEMVKAFEAWNECMDTFGFEPDNGPFFADRIVAREIDRVVRLRDPADQGVDTEPQVWVSAKQIAELQSFESRVFAADSHCLQVTVAGAMMMDAETEVLDRLADLFPGYAGVADS